MLLKRTLSLALLCLIGYSSLKYYTHHTLENDLQETLYAIKPLLKADYRDLSTSLFAQSYQLSEVQIQPKNFNQPVSIKTLRFQGSDFFDPNNHSLFTHKPGRTQKIQAHEISVHFKDVWQASYPTFEWPISPKTLQGLGYDPLNFDISSTIESSSDAQYIRINSKQVFKNMFDLTFQGIFSKPTYLSEKNKSAIQWDQFYLVEATLIYEDQQFITSWLTHQAGIHQITVSQMQEKWFDDVLKYLKAHYVELDADSKKALHRFIKNPQTLTIRLKPMPFIKLSQFEHLTLYKPEDVRNMLKLRLSSP